MRKIKLKRKHWKFMISPHYYDGVVVLNTAKARYWFNDETRNGNKWGGEDGREWSKEKAKRSKDRGFVFISESEARKLFKFPKKMPV